MAAQKANPAMTLVSAGKDDEPRRLYEEALEVFPEVVSRPLPHYAPRATAYGVWLTRRRRYEEAEHQLRHGLETLKSLIGPDDERTRTAAAHLVELYDA